MLESIFVMGNRGALVGLQWVSFEGIGEICYPLLPEFSFERS